MTEDIDRQLAEAASEPRRAEVDGQAVENHSLSDLVKLGEYLGRRNSGRNPNGVIRVAKIKGNSSV